MLTFFGLISYAMYMVHLYVMRAYDHFDGTPLRRMGSPRFFAVLGITIAACLFSRYLIESPAISLRRFVLTNRLSQTPTRRRCLLETCKLSPLAPVTSSANPTGFQAGMRRLILQIIRAELIAWAERNEGAFSSQRHHLGNSGRSFLTSSMIRLQGHSPHRAASV